MERQVQFRDYQEQVAEDHNDIQAYVREAFDSLVRDAVSKARRYSELQVTKTGQVEITVAPGKVYDNGAVFGRRTSIVQSMSTYTAAAARRIVTVSAYGNEVDTDVESRDFLVNVETGQVEPRAVSMTRSRDVQVVFTAGAEGVDPVPPPVPVTHVVVAHVLMDTTQVVSVTMVGENRVESTANLDTRADLLEAFKAQIEPRVASLASDLASLQNELRGRSDKDSFGRIFQDLARVKAKLRFPDNAVGYGSDFFLTPAGSDVENLSTLGYDAAVEQGIRFPAANANEFEISLFSANDPNASVSNGVLLPKYTEEVKISTGRPVSDLGIAQYGFQTHQIKQGYMSRSRLRWGGWYFGCSNNNYYDERHQAPGLSNLYDVQSTAFDVITQINYINDTGYENHIGVHWWYDTWKEPFLYTETVNHVINGAHVAQTFLVSNDMWATKLGLWFTAKGANEDVHVALCEVTAGTPDLSKTVAKTVLPHAAIKVNEYSLVPLAPTFLQKGRRYAVVIISNANHKVGMSTGSDYLDGTFFYSTDGIYYQGDLTKDMAMVVYGARFNASQVTVEFAPMSLNGGLRNIDILAEMWVPQSTELVFEIRPNGTGAWVPVTEDTSQLLRTGSAPPVCHFRARFIGTRDMAPALKLTGSRVKIMRPKTALQHVTDVKTVPATNTVKVKVLLEGYQDSDGSAGSAGTPHEYALKLRVGAGNTLVNPTAVTQIARDLQANRYEREYTFSVTGATQFRLQSNGSTTSEMNTYHVAEMTYFTL